MAIKKIKACIYGRKSRENAATLENQINACKDWVKKHELQNIEIEVIEIFEETGTASSEDWNRPKLQEMIKKIKLCDFDMVIVSEQTRIARNEDFGRFKKLMKETGTAFACADSNEVFDFNNPNDNFKVGVLHLFGELELSTAKIRLKRGTIQSAKQGNYQGKKPPFGYEYNRDTKKLKKNKDAAVARKMFEMYMAGMSTVEISYDFTQNNVLAYHKVKGEMVPITWSKSTIARSLKNVVYRGHTLFGKTKINGMKEQVKNEEENILLIENTHEAIITQEEWELVQSIMNKKRTQPPAMKHAKHVFSGLIACAFCGKHHTFERQADSKKEWRISSCQQRNYSDDFTTYKMCKNSGCKLKFVEALFYPLLENIEKSIDNYIELIKQKKLSNKEMQKIKKTQKEGKAQQIQKLKRRRKNIIDNIEIGDFYEEEEVPEKRNEVKLLLSEIKKLESELTLMNEEEEQSETVQIEKVKTNIRKFLTGKETGMPAREQNEILKEFIQDIVYKKAGKDAAVEIEVHLKENIKEMFEEIQKVEAEAS
jgi:DNA invertase Pin-like site-specific DNA recombinase